MTQKIAILGAGGMIGSKLARYVGGRGDIEFISFSHAEVDVTQPAAMRKTLQELKPDWVIYAAAFLGPDQCHKEPQKSYAVNYKGVADLAEILVEMNGPKLIHFSSDFVFDGKEGGYDENGVALPVNIYGLHKYLADEAIMQSGVPAYILRIASVIGAGEGQRDFIKAILGRVAGGAEKLSVIEEYQISTSTPKFLAWVIGELLNKKPAFGLYNTVASGSTSWRALAIVALAELGISIPVDPIPATAFPTPAARPPKNLAEHQQAGSRDWPAARLGAGDPRTDTGFAGELFGGGRKENLAVAIIQERKRPPHQQELTFAKAQT